MTALRAFRSNVWAHNLRAVSLQHNATDGRVRLMRWLDRGRKLLGTFNEQGVTRAEVYSELGAFADKERSCTNIGVYYVLSKRCHLRRQQL